MRSYNYCLDNSIELQYIRAIISLLALDAREKSKENKLEVQSNLNDLFSLVKKKEFLNINYSKFNKQLGNLTYLYGFKNFSAQFYANVDSVDEITYVNLLALRPTWQIDRKSVHGSFNDIRYRFFISLIEKYSKLAKRDQEIFTTTNYFDSLYNEYSSVDSSYLAVANKLFKNFMKKYQDRLIEIKNQRKIKSSDYDKINEKIYEVTNKLDTLAQSPEVPPYLPLKDNNERFVDILILPDKIESEE